MCLESASSLVGRFSEMCPSHVWGVYLQVLAGGFLHSKFGCALPCASNKSFAGVSHDHVVNICVPLQALSAKPWHPQRPLVILGTGHTGVAGWGETSAVSSSPSCPRWAPLQAASFLRWTHPVSQVSLTVLKLNSCFALWFHAQSHLLRFTLNNLSPLFLSRICGFWVS